jgi:hypothetical protein
VFVWDIYVYIYNCHSKLLLDLKAFDR